MSKEKPAGSDASQALLTLDQLSQTIEVMSEVVDRLKRHLSKQLRQREQQLEAESQEPTETPGRKSGAGSSEAARDKSPEDVELEISTYRRRMTRKASRVIH